MIEAGCLDDAVDCNDTVDPTESEVEDDLDSEVREQETVEDNPVLPHPPVRSNARYPLRPVVPVCNPSLR